MREKAKHIPTNPPSLGTNETTKRTQNKEKTEASMKS